ncbi:mandelate racemase/muconate lactonizing enzyme family protein [Caldinitratiruptor microaerophilus]|uniref:Mandelate racemase n=1 Tax=Caldinitratiruptor microaerophilus TaxID=671077 RepID=A0AA35CKE0_9FIRM|nr:mandelate racemase/muconate lactonizing enzyme family protein [Caldinitratiruptor microaerophilus]BDG60129.1 mandelate racemase [Caldinitratiruptor microaerophilus]
MKITQVEAYHLRLPAVEAICNGTQDALVVRIDTDEGISGWGEVDSSPHVIKAIYDTPSSHTLSYGLRELLIGEDPFDIRRLWDRMYRGSIYYGRRGAALQAISGADIALWDIVGKATGKPVWKLLGGAYHRRVRAYASALMPENPDDAAAFARQNLARGFKAMKFGWGPLGKDPGRDEALVAAVRDAVGPDVDIMIDVGHAWDAPTAIERIRRLSSYRLYWIEEPLFPDDLDGYARLCDAVDVRIAAGEEDTGRFAFVELMDRGRVHVVQPDVSRCGGLTEALRIADLAYTRGRMVVPHAFSTGILLAASLHFAAAIPNGGLLEYVVDGSPLSDGLARVSFSLEDGHISVPDKPGLGIEVDLDVLGRYRVE